MKYKMFLEYCTDPAPGSYNVCKMKVSAAAAGGIYLILYNIFLCILY